jgi:hypothetical protein
MNLLENYIKKIISEDKIQNPENGNEYYRVQAEINCYGHKEIVNRLFPIEEWEKAKKQGYYIG